MKLSVGTPTGLIMQVFAILLLIVAAEFAVSSFWVERVSRYSLRDEEAHRLAEHLVIARKLLADKTPEQRLLEAVELTTSRYEIRWLPSGSSRALTIRASEPLLAQIVAWEPTLADSRLIVGPTNEARDTLIEGIFHLRDGSMVYFRTRHPLGWPARTTDGILLALGVAVFLALVGGLLVRRTLMPMHRLAEAAARFDAGEPVEISESGPGEVRRTIVAFNHMQRRIQRLVSDRTQAMAAMGHDMRTPLARLRLRAEYLQDSREAQAIVADIAEMEAMIASLLAFLGGEAETEARVAVDLAVLCATIADDFADRGLAVRYVGPEHLDALVRPIAIKRAITNLVDNAIRYAGEAAILLDAGNGLLHLRIEDSGPGVPNDALERITQPFVRLDSARARDTKGFGLGLAIVSRIVDGEGGTFKLVNRPEGGLRALIDLPSG